MVVPQSQEYLKAFGETVLNNAKALIIGLDSQGKLVLFSASCEKLTGWTTQEAIGQDWFAIFVPAPDRPPGGFDLNELVKQTESKIPLLTRLGPPRIISWHYALLEESNLLIGTGIDVTDQKQVEEVLPENKGHYRSVITAMAEGVPHYSHNEPLPYTAVASFSDITEPKESEEARQMLISLIESSSDFIALGTPDGQLLFLNEAGLKLTGLDSLAQARTYRVVDFVPDESVDMFRNQIFPQLEREGHWEGEFRLRNFKTDAIIPIQYSAFTVTNRHTGQLIAYATISRDITERKQAEADLQKAKEAAEAASRAKSEFLATMSHEIRTPMNAIMGMADLLWETPLNEHQQEYVQVFRRSGHVLLNLLNDILDLSKVEAGQLDLEKVTFDPNELVTKVIENLRLSAYEKNLALSCQIRPGVPTYITGDPNRLQQVLVNLVGNAIKFTEKGNIKIVLQTDPASMLLFSISDTGIGIKPEHLGLIFNSFTQSDSSITRRYGGTGLGLTISKRLVELMGGQIWVDSLVGQGSTFYFSIKPENKPSGPTSSLQPPSQPQENSANQTPCYILLVDDAEDNRLLVRAYLRRTHYQLDVAENGEEAVEKFKNVAYDLVLMDMQMPVMDGYSATRAIRQWEAQQSLEPKPIIALTAYALKEDAQKTLDAGCTAYLTKPVKKATLLETLTHYTKGGA